METKFEYQVSPELAENIALEQFDILLRRRGVKLRYLPLGLGFLLALLLLCLSTLGHSMAGGPIYSSTWNFGGTYYAFTEGFLPVPAGFVFGIGFGLLINFFLRTIILSMARSTYAKMGPARTASWNAESFTFQSPSYEIKVHWQMIDKIEVGSLGVYGFSGRKAFFAIPKEAFPPSVTTEELTRTWQSHRMQPSLKA